ncbi:MAG: HAD-IC family P-type ATPase [Pseudonocardiaceae bacterium]
MRRYLSDIGLLDAASPGRHGWSTDGRVHLEVRGVDRPGSEQLADDVERRLYAVPGVHRVEVNAVLGRVLVGFDEQQAGRAELIAAIEEAERAHPAAGGPGPAQTWQHPSDPRPLGWEMVVLAGQLAGAALSVTGRMIRLPRLPDAVPAAVSLADHTPKLRQALESRVGPEVTDVAFALGEAAAQSLAQRPLALVVEVTHRLSMLTQAYAQQQAWQRREPELGAQAGDYRAGPLERPARPLPLPPGPVERYANRAAPVAAAAYAATLGLTGSPDRALGVLLAGVPRPARMGRDAFAAQLSRSLAQRGVVGFERHALRRLDRIDMVVVDPSVLLTGRQQIGEIVALDDVAAELDPLAEALIDAARSAGTVVLAGDSSGLAERLGVQDTVAGGSQLAMSVQRLQQHGHTVALISARQRSALAAADLGIGVLRPGAAPPWGAQLLCGPGLADACRLIGAIGEARQVSVRSTQLALTGWVTGGVLSLGGPAGSAPVWASMTGQATALIAVAAGAWSGLSVASRALPTPVDRTPWHAIPTDVVLDRLGSTLDGLAPADAECRRDGDEEPAGESAAHSLARAVVDELANPLTPTLAAGAGVSAVVGSVVDALTITTVLAVNAIVGAGQRVAADRALRRLVSASAMRVRLRRGGAEVEAETEELVVGDVITLRAGDAVPADCRVLLAEGLEMDESSLTGESQLVTKSSEPTGAEAIGDRASMLYQGTAVAAGNAVAVVTATGTRTETGRTAHLGSRSPTRSGGVEQRLRQLMGVTLPISISAGVVLFATSLLRGRSVAAALGPAVSLAVAALPEGLPFVAKVAELAAARRLSGRGALVRNPATIETLGRVDVLCFDKTGTLTEGRIGLRTVSDGRTDEPVEQLSRPRSAVLAAALRASPRHDDAHLLPHPTDRAVVDGGAELGITPAHDARNWQRVDELPFEPGRSYHAVLGRFDGGPLLSVKGAPEIVLARCESWLLDGETVAFDAAAQHRVAEEVDRLARAGHRVLAVAERPASDRRDLDDDRIARLRLVGLLGLTDTIRPTAAQAVATLQQAGVQIVMITGDHPSTAQATAAKLGAVNNRGVMTGSELDALDDAALADALPQVAVFARVSPAQKARIVDGLQRAGRTVAVTGDGANDAPAIRLAHVGVAVGSGATPAAREAADLIVTDDRLETITEALIEGRAVWASVRDALAVLLGGNVGEIAFTIGSALLSGTDALNARQLLLVNLLTDMLPAMAIAVRPPRGTTPEQLLAEGPDASLGTALNREIVLRASVTASAATVAWLAGRATGTPTRASTIALVALVSAQLAQTAAVGTQSPLVLGASAISLGALAAVVQTPGLSGFFGCRPLGPLGWTIALGSAGGAAALGVVVPRAYRRL